MLSGVGSEKVYLACGATDLRKSIDGLAAIVQECYGGDPFSESIYVFCNKGRDRLKILRWQRNGFWLYIRRLEDGRFRWPADGEAETLEVGARELGWILEGLSLEQADAHRAIHPKEAV